MSEQPNVQNENPDLSGNENPNATGGSQESTEEHLPRDPFPEPEHSEFSSFIMSIEKKIIEWETSHTQSN